MNLEKELIKKLRENVNNIYLYLQAWQKDINDTIHICFGDKKKCMLNISKDYINGSIGCIPAYFNNKTLPRNTEYEIELIKHWEEVKNEFDEKVKKQKSLVDLINNFKL